MTANIGLEIVRNAHARAVEPGADKRLPPHQQHLEADIILIFSGWTHLDADKRAQGLRIVSDYETAAGLEGGQVRWERSEGLRVSATASPSPNLTLNRSL